MVREGGAARYGLGFVSRIFTAPRYENGSEERVEEEEEQTLTFCRCEVHVYQCVRARSCVCACVFVPTRVCLCVRRGREVCEREKLYRNVRAMR